MLQTRLMFRWTCVAVAFGWSGVLFSQYDAGQPVPGQYRRVLAPQSSGYSPASNVQTAAHSAYARTGPTQQVVSFRHQNSSGAIAPAYNEYPQFPFAAPDSDYGSCPSYDGGYDPLMHRCPNGSCTDNRRSWRHCWVKTCYDPKPAYALPNYGYHPTSWRQIDNGSCQPNYSDAVAPMQSPAQAPVEPPSSVPRQSPAQQQAPGVVPAPPESAPNSMPRPVDPQNPPPAIEKPQPATVIPPNADRRTPPPRIEEELPEVEAGLAPIAEANTPPAKPQETIPQKSQEGNLIPSNRPSVTPRGETGTESNEFLPPLPALQKDRSETERSTTGDTTESQPAAKPLTDVSPSHSSEQTQKDASSSPASREKKDAPSADLKDPSADVQPNSEDKPREKPTAEELRTSTENGSWEMPVPRGGNRAAQSRKNSGSASNWQQRSAARSVSNPQEPAASRNTLRGASPRSRSANNSQSAETDSLESAKSNAVPAAGSKLVRW